MASLGKLPSELRLRIFEFVLLDSTTTHGNDVAFGECGPCESLTPNVFVTLPASALINNNIEKVVAVAGSRRGFYNGIGRKSLSLWDTVPLCAVNRRIRLEALEVWSQHTVKVGTWLSYLRRSAPASLLAAVQIVEFNFLIKGKWKPGLLDRLGYAVDAWTRSINSAFFERMEALADIPGLPWEQVEIQHRLMEDSPFMYRIPAGTVKREELGVHTWLSGKAVAEALKTFHRQRRWPDEPVVVDGIVAPEDTEFLNARGLMAAPQHTMYS